MSKQIREIDLVPDPKILVVLTYASMKPIDSLCELIDNAIDSFSLEPRTERPLVLIDLPTRKELRDKQGMLRVRDNGPGLSLDQMEKALRAGFSSKYSYDSLGLFGVGFNIASGKLGQITRFITIRREDDFALEAKLDLQKLRRQGDYKLMPKIIEKPENSVHGTIVEITEPWPEGNQNHGFMLKLIQQGLPTILRTLGRRYATILKDKNIRIQIGNDTVEAFEHCVWSPERYVERQKHGKIYAKYEFNKVIHAQRRCVECGSLIIDGGEVCRQKDCGSSSIKTMEERVYGWLGIQRYLDLSHFGIDLIRNGRAIRTLEKSAFFEFIDENGNPIVDYPIDDRTGRIIGEVHLDHVPVDPAKQDFERSSPEWRRAIEFLRGDSSLQPTKPNADSNKSIIFRLYQGYRKVRTPGKHDLYMGKWQPGADKAVLLTSTEVDELKKKFDEREPGYFEDIEWWRLVEAADTKPLKGLKKCPECHADCVDESEECPSCGYVFEGKLCINNDCKARLPRSAVSCPQCGANQIPKVYNPWECKVCGNSNPEEAEICGTCDSHRGSPNPLQKETLVSKSVYSEELSIEHVSIELASGENSSPLGLRTYVSNSPIVLVDSTGKKTRLPLIRFIESDIEVVLDLGHSLFTTLRLAPEQILAYEMSQYIFTINQGLASRYPGAHSISNIATAILSKYWANRLDNSDAETKRKADELLQWIKERLIITINDNGEDVYKSLNEKEAERLVIELLNRKKDPADLKDMIATGEFFQFLSPSAILSTLRRFPHLFFDGKVWKSSFANLDVPETTIKRAQEEILCRYHNCLESVVLYLESSTHEPNESSVAAACYEILTDKIVE